MILLPEVSRGRPPAWLRMSDFRNSTPRADPVGRAVCSILARNDPAPGPPKLTSFD